MLIRLILGAGLIMSTAACLVENDLDGNAREVRARISSASISIGSEGEQGLDFVFEYLLGLADADGVDAVEWTYSLLNLDGRVLASETQEMREAQLDKTEVFVQGERPRTLPLDGVELDAESRYVLKVSLRYRGEILFEKFASLSLDSPHEDLDAIPDIPSFSTR
ncbi:MAG: hypothetical protein ACON3Z_01515 [Bradymonadia bacterium]